MQNNTLLIAAIMLCPLISSCKQSDKASEPLGEKADIANKDAMKKWLEPQTVFINRYPPFTLGSPYKEIFSAIVTLGKPKDEFETTRAFQDRIDSLPRKVADKFGSHFAFKSMAPATRWNADKGMMKIIHRDEDSSSEKIMLAFVDDKDISMYWGLYIQGCHLNPSINLPIEIAKKVQERSSVSLFYVGTIDFSKKGWVRKANTANYETIPGFHYTTQIGYSDKLRTVFEADFNVNRIDFVEESSGNILASISCA